MKKYKVNIAFFFTAKNEEDALGIADTIAGNIEEDYETPHGSKVEAQVCPPSINKKDMDAIAHVVSYLYADERKHWEEGEKPRRHIYHSVQRLAKFLGDEKNGKHGIIKEK